MAAGQNFGFEDVVEPMFEMGQDAFRLPLEELLQYEMGDGGRTAGYKKVSTPCATPRQPLPVRPADPAPANLSRPAVPTLTRPAISTLSSSCQS